MAAAMRERGVALRPHAKTHKSLEFARRQVAAGAVGLTVATIGEAEVFADGGFDDLFIAYPVIAAGPKAERLVRLAERCSLSVGADSVVGVEALAAAFAGRAAGRRRRRRRDRCRWGADRRAAGCAPGRWRAMRPTSGFGSAACSPMAATATAAATSVPRPPRTR